MEGLDPFRAFVTLLGFALWDMICVLLIFIQVGLRAKALASSWLCLHLQYYLPLQH